MHVINASNVHSALPLGFAALKCNGVWTETRNGAAVSMDAPVVTVYKNPTERVLFWPERDANPFFHLYEGLWMLNGSDDVASVVKYAKNMASFSDDGKKFHGAYGKRWRSWFGYDQLDTCIQALKRNPKDRRVVLGMWDPSQDLLVGIGGGKDVPCNLTIHFRINPLTHHLDMTVFCRSNDVVWGAYGANAVHMSMMMEYVAAGVGVYIGRYYQVSDDFHCYKNHWDKLNMLSKESGDPYEDNRALQRTPLIQCGRRQWDMEVTALVNEGSYVAVSDPFLSYVVVPVLKAHEHYRKERGLERYDGAIEILQQCRDWDWRRVCTEWMERRKLTFLKASDDGVSHE